MDRLGGGHQRDNETDWVFGELPVSILTEDGSGQGVKAWPAIVDQGEAVGLRVFDTLDEAALEHHHGVLRLLALTAGQQVARPAQTPWCECGGFAGLECGRFTRIADRRTAAKQPVTGGRRPPGNGIRDEAAFRALLENVRAELGPLFRRQSGYLNKTLKTWS